MPDYRFRRVCNLNELKEKIYLFDEGFDDREIEVLKLMIELRENRMEAPITGRLLFVELGTNEDGSPAIRFAQLGQERLKSLTVSAGALEAVAESLQGKLPAEEDMSPVWPTVNRAYAMAVMKSVRKQVGENERLEE